MVEISLNLPVVQGAWTEGLGVKLKKLEGLCDILRGMGKGVCSD